MKILGNLVWGLISHQKHLLYRSCILLITLYEFQLWHYNRVPLFYPLKMLGKMQRRAAIWILGAFKIFPSFGIKAITGLIPINLHLQKLSGRSQLWAYSLSPNYILWFLMEPITGSSSGHHSFSLGILTKCQHEIIKGPLVDIDNRFNKVFPLFNPLHPEFSPGHRVIDNFSSCFSFHLFNKSKDTNFKACI